MGRPTVLTTYIHTYIHTCVYNMVYICGFLPWISLQGNLLHATYKRRRDPRGFILQTTVNAFRKRLATRVVLASAGLPGRSGRQRRRQ